MTKLDLNGPFKSPGNLPAKLRADLRIGIKPGGELTTITGTRDDMHVFESANGSLWLVDSDGKTRNGHQRIRNGQGERLRFKRSAPVTPAVDLAKYTTMDENEPEWKDRVLAAVVKAWREGQLITLYALVAAARIPTSPPDTTVKHWIEQLGDAGSRVYNLRPYLFSEKPLAFGRDGIK